MAKEQTYELVVIFDSQGEESEIKREFDVVQSLIEKRSKEFIGRAEWGLKELKYPIKKRKSGYYVYYLFNADVSVPTQIAHALKMDEKVLRHLIVKANQNSAGYLDKLEEETDIITRESEMEASSKRNRFSPRRESGEVKQSEADVESVEETVSEDETTESSTNQENVNIEETDENREEQDSQSGEQNEPKQMEDTINVEEKEKTE